jgi:hypothetical protein
MLVVSTGAGIGQGGSADARSYNPSIAAVATGDHSHTTAPHTLTIPEMPSHTHPPKAGGYNFMTFSHGVTGGSGDRFNSTTETGSTGGGASHSHGDTGTDGGHNHTINYSNYAPFYFTLIAATKD